MTIATTTEAPTGAAFEFPEDDQLLLVNQGVDLIGDSYCGVATRKNADCLMSDGYIVGVTDLGNGMSIFNNQYGTIIGGNAIYIEGEATYISNFGLISGSVAAIVVNSQDSFQVMNSGTIQGGMEGIDFFGRAVIDNSGRITSTYIGISVGYRATGEITNSGFIQGDTASIAIDPRLTSRSISIVNTGTLQGDVLLGNLANRVSNSGKIIGDVSLGDGGSVYNGHGGVIVGTIFGGKKADKLIAGNDGEQLVGGQGHDQLYGGAGSDAFVFSSYAAADSDVVKGFNVLYDTIQLDHTVFTHLAADKPPAFAIGTKATSATDFLFYNSGTGNLYYDPDGSRTAQTPSLVANFRPGLNLTAGNFDVY